MTAEDRVAVAARATAVQLTARHGSGVQAEVEAALAARSTTQRRDQYLDPVSLGGLIVAIATLAWTIYTDLRNKTPQPPPAVIARHVRMELSTGTTADCGAASAQETGQITQIII